MDSELWNDTNENLNDYDNIIHLHTYKIKKKNATIIDGLKFINVEEIKKFMTNVKKKLGIAGYEANIEQFNEKEKVFVFTGDNMVKIKNILINEYGKSDEHIIIHY